MGALSLTGCSGVDLPSFTFPDGKLYYGASTPRDDLTAFEDSLGGPLSCYRSYFKAGEEDLLHEQVAADLAAGRMPITSIKPPGSWAETAKNTAWIDGLLEPLGDDDQQIFLAVHHEPENDAPAYGEPSEYLALQHALLERAAVKARNVVVVPILGTWSFDDRAERTPDEWDVIDAPVFGLDLYNPWSPTNGKEWVPFADKLSMAQDTAGDRPLLIGEYACRSDPSQPGRAAEWMSDAFQSALDGGVVAMSYFNSPQNSPDGTWELDAETFPVFAGILSGPDVAWI